MTRSGTNVRMQDLDRCQDVNEGSNLIFFQVQNVDEEINNM